MAAARQSSGDIVVWGGEDESGPVADVWRSTDDGGSWVLVTSSPGFGARQDMAGVALSDGTLIHVGGHDGVSYLTSTYVSTDSGITFTQAGDIGGAMVTVAVVLANDHIVVAGGESGASTYEADVYMSADAATTWTAQVASAAPWSARGWHAMAVVGGSTVVLAGGVGTSGLFNDVWSSDDEGVTWTLVTSSAAWSPRQQFKMVLFNSTLWVVGGVDAAEQHLNDAWSSVDGGASWQQSPSIGTRVAVTGAAAVVLSSGALLVMGGEFPALHDAVTVTQPVLSTRCTFRFLVPPPSRKPVGLAP